MRTSLFLLSMVAAIGLTGCPSGSNSTSEPAHTQVSEHAPKNVTPASVKLTIGDEKKFAELVAAEKGKVVLIDFWATWCEPCMEYFPHTVAAHRKYQERGLATIAVNFDLLDKEPAVREFLAKQEADFTNLMSNYDDIGQEVGEAFQWDALPEIRLYDRAGKLRYEWTAKPEDLDKRIEELLAE